jgi:urease gamma subunit
MQAYILFASPPLFLMTSAFFFMLNEYKNKVSRYKWFYQLILVLLILLPVRYMFERVKPFHQINRNPDWVLDLKKLNQQNINKGLLLNYDKPIEAMFYTNLTVYSDIPDEQTIIDLLNKGYKIMIQDDESVPNTIKAIKGIEIVKLSSELN